MDCSIKNILIVVILFLSTSVNGQNMYQEDTTSLTLEDLGFVFDETRTKVGNDFFRMFYKDWNNPTNIKGVSIYIGEKPIPGLGTQIWVKVESRIIYKSVLRPNPEQLKREVIKALRRTYNYFVNYEVIQKQLDSEDYSGNGLY